MSFAPGLRDRPRDTGGEPFRRLSRAVARQLDPEGGAVSGCRFGADASAVGLDDGPGDGQPEPAAAGSRQCGRRRLDGSARRSVPAGRVGCPARCRGPRSRADRRMARARIVMRSPGPVCATALRIRLRSTWVSRSGSASACRRPDQLEVALPEQRQVAPEILEEVMEVYRARARSAARPRRWPA